MPDDLEPLLDQIERWSSGVPVRLMQRVLALGESALPAIVDRIPNEDDEEREPLWYLALLAELRAPAAVPALIDRLDSVKDVLLRVVAAEGLAKIGAPAIPALREITAHGREETRLFAYGALGWIRDEAAFATLVDAVQHDAPLAHVAATALVDHFRPEVVPALYAAYQRCQSWQRTDIAGAIHDLHWGIHQAQPISMDWRLRYFNDGSVVGVELSWLGISSILYEDRDRLADAKDAPVQSLAEIVGETAEELHPPEYCEDCGALIEKPTGIPICPENALDVVRLQLNFLQQEREAGLDDLFDILNEVDMDLWDLTHEPTPRSAKKRAARQEEQDYLAFLRSTCMWSIGKGLETIGPARATLLAQVGELADRYGIKPENAPQTPVARTEPKLGRNDRCRCGSGKKYKSCCLT